MKEWEIWFASFPYEEDHSIVKERPVIILDVDTLNILSIKVTTHLIRDDDIYDTPIFRWKECGLCRPSIARVSKAEYLTKEQFTARIGEIHDNDKKNIGERYMKYISEKDI